MTDATGYTEPFHPPAWRSARRGISAAFALQGFVIGSWALHVPFLIERLGITKSAMGLVIVLFGVGSLIAMALLGVLLPRTGSRRPAQIAVIASALFVPVLAITPSYAATLGVAPVLSAIVGVASVALNAQGVEAERRAERTFMSSFHGFWSLGILMGSILGGFVAAAVGPSIHAAMVLGLVVLIGALIWPHLLEDREAEREGSARLGLPRVLAVWILGIVILFAFTLDGAAIDWSAVLMRQELGAPVWLWGWPLAALQGVMMIMRFAGDGLRGRMGDETLLRWGGILGAVGFALAGLAGLEALDGMPMPLRASMAIAGFALAGLGMANVVPVTLSLAGRVPGVHGGTALAIVSAHGHLGILFMPASIGWLGEQFGFGATFAGLALLPAVIAALATVARHSDQAAGPSSVAEDAMR